MRSDSYERIHRTSLSLSLFLHPPPFSLLGTTTARGTDSHTSRVSIKRGRKWRALVDRCGLAHGSAKREKQGEKKHTCATVRPREWVCFAMKKMSSYPSIIIELPSSRVSTFITTDYYPTRSLPVSPDFIIQFAGAIFIARIVLCPRVERVGGGGRNLFPAGKSFVVRITGLRVEKSVAQRVVQASTRHIPSRGRLARHRKRFWPKTAPRIPTSSAPVIGPDRENKDSHGHNRGSTSGYGPVPYSYEHSATPAPPIYPASYPCTLRTLVE